MIPFSDDSRAHRFPAVNVRTDRRELCGVAGAYFVLYPNSRVLTFVLWLPIRIPAWFYRGGWFLYQFFERNYSLATGPLVTVVSRSSHMLVDSSSV
jgi:hypothetical protein